MLTVYGVYRSRASRVYWMVEELGIPIQSVPVIQARRIENPLAADAPFNTRSPKFFDINPMGLIPCIKDGDLIMHESLAITLYLERKYGAGASRSAEEDGQVTMWSLWAATEIEPHSVRIVLTYDNGLDAQEEGRNVISSSVEKLRAPLTVLDRHLATREWLVGGQFTAADLNLAEVLRYAQTERRLFDANPNVEAWIKRCQSRPAYKAMQAKRGLEPA